MIDAPLWMTKIGFLGFWNWVMIYGMLAFLDSFLLYWLSCLVKPCIALFSFPQNLQWRTNIAFEAGSIPILLICIPPLLDFVFFLFLLSLFSTTANVKKAPGWPKVDSLLFSFLLSVYFLSAAEQSKCEEKHVKQKKEIERAKAIQCMT